MKKHGAVCLLLGFSPLLPAQIAVGPGPGVTGPSLSVQGMPVHVATGVAGAFVDGGPTLSLSSGIVFLSTPPVSGAPYCADMTTTSLQTLIDGNQIEHMTKASTCRDGQGRVRNEQYLPEHPGQNVSSGEPMKMITIQDPIAGVSYVLDPLQKIAHRNATRTMKQIGDFSETKIINAGPITTGPITTAMGTLTPENEITLVKTDLGTQIIQGLPAKGTKTTTTFAAGSIGNKQPVEVTDESWFSENLHTVVMSKHSDPRMGVTSYELTNINRAEPAASQFQVPADYTVKENESPTMLTVQGAAHVHE